MDSREGVLASGVERVAAPRPIFRMRDQAAFHRVVVHVVQLLDSLFLTPHIEVVKPALPELRQRFLRAKEAKVQLSCGHALASVAPQLPRDALLQDLQYRRGSSLRRLADQKVDVLWHILQWNYAVALMRERGEMPKPSGKGGPPAQALNVTDPFNSADTQNCTYAEDDLARIQSANCGSAWAQTFGYDAFGNISKTGSSSFQPTYSPTTNRMTALPGFTPTYDANGNVTSDSLHTSGIRVRIERQDWMGRIPGMHEQLRKRIRRRSSLRENLSLLLLVLVGLSIATITDRWGMPQKWHSAILETLVAFWAVMMSYRLRWSRWSFWAALSICFMVHAAAIWIFLQYILRNLDRIGTIFAFIPAFVEFFVLLIAVKRVEERLTGKHEIVKLV